jgi:hypothetical protein
MKISNIIEEGYYDFDDHYDAKQGGEYGKDLTYAHGGSYGPGAGRDDIFKGQASNLPADPFSRTSGAVPKADGSGRVHTIALPNEVDDVDEGKKKSEPPEADYGDDYQAMVSRVKKLAGLGPLKTVYDPAKRVYKNMPTAVQPKK